MAEAAVTAGVSGGLLYKEWKTGKGPVSFHVGRSRRVRSAALEAWIKARKRDESITPAAA
jgi:hypothetical protein